MKKEKHVNVLLICIMIYQVMYCICDRLFMGLWDKFLLGSAYMAVVIWVADLAVSKADAKEKKKHGLPQPFNNPEGE